MKKIHKIKVKRTKDEFQLLNDDGTWNIYCNTYSCSIEASNYWNMVTCKNCLKLKGEQAE